MGRKRFFGFLELEKLARCVGGNGGRQRVGREEGTNRKQSVGPSVRKGVVDISMRRRDRGAAAGGGQRVVPPLVLFLCARFSQLIDPGDAILRTLSFASGMVEGERKEARKSTTCVAAAIARFVVSRLSRCLIAPFNLHMFLKEKVLCIHRADFPLRPPLVFFSLFPHACIRAVLAFLSFRLPISFSSSPVTRSMLAASLRILNPTIRSFGSSM